MVATLLIGSYITFILIAYGLAGRWMIQLFFAPDDHGIVSLPITALLGLVVLNVISALLSLVIPLGLGANIIIFIGACFLYYKLKKNNTINMISLGRTELGVMVLAGLLVLENATHASGNPDTNLYHAQAIRWIENYHVVPGLGNLHSRFAFNSNWLVLNALFSFAFLKIQSFHLLPGLFFFISVLYFLSGISEIAKGKFLASNLFKTLLIPISFHIWASEISSPGTDMPANVLIWIIISLWLEVYENNSKVKRVIILLLSLLAITFKLSALPILLLPAYDFLIHLKNREIALVRNILVLVVICVTPWILRNFVISGYWAYPVPALISFSPKVDWQIPEELVRKEARIVQTWARQYNLNAKTSNLPWEWMSFWLSRLTPLQFFIFWISFLSPFIYGTIAVFDKPVHYLAYWCSYIGVLFWLFSAPDIRFGYGFLITVNLLVIIPIVNNMLAYKKIFGVLLNTLILFYLGVILANSFEPSTFSKRFLFPEPYLEFPAKNCEIANATIKCALNYGACGYTEFPCVPKGRDTVEMRSSDWQDGFRNIKLRGE